MTQPESERPSAPGEANCNSGSDRGSVAATEPPSPHFLHSASILFVLIARIRSYLIPAIVASVAAAGGSRFLAMVLGFGFLVTLVFDLMRLYTLRYYIAGGELVVRHGLLSRQQRSIPLRRIQNIDLLQNPLHRLFRVAEVRVETASGSEPEATLRVLSLPEVERLRRQLVAGTPATTKSVAPGLPAEPITVPARNLLSISPVELTVLGLISNRGMVLVAVAVGALYESDLHERLDWAWAEQAARRAQQAGLATAIIAGLLGLAAALIALRLLSVMWFLLRFFDYRLTGEGDNLRVSAGLLTRVSATVPRRRIQFISIHRSLLARWLGRASIRIETAGGGGKSEEDAGATIARRWFVPIIKERSVNLLMRELRPGLAWNEQSFPWQSAHPRAGQRLMRLALLSSIGLGLAGLAVWRPYGALVGPLLLPLLLWHARRYARSLRYARFDEGIAFRSGVLLKKTSVTFFDKVQVVGVLQTPFDRRWNMARLQIDTAAAGPAEHRVDVRLLEAQFARDELQAISERAARRPLLC